VVDNIVFEGAPGIYNIAEPSPSVSVAKAQRELGWVSGFRAKESTASSAR
jgi:hypothetical protein